MLSKRLFVTLWLLCLIGSWAIVPYALHLGIFPPSVPLQQLLLLIILQSATLFGIVCWLSYLILPKTDLKPFAVGKVGKQVVLSGVVSGVLVGGIILLLDRVVFQSSALSAVHTPAWMGVLASLYGAINEEVLLRLFFFTLVYLLLSKIFTIRHRSYFLWGTNVIVALIFGLGHFPAAFKMIEPSSFEISRVLLLNGIPSLVFGWLYWSRGLWSAMTAHFMADLMIHVFF